MTMHILPSYRVSRILSQCYARSIILGPAQESPELLFVSRKPHSADHYATLRQLLIAIRNTERTRGNLPPNLANLKRTKNKLPEQGIEP